MKKQFILSADILKVIGDDVPIERAKEITKQLTNNWAFLVYPESAPSNWLDILQSYYIPFGVSPIHDKDVLPHGEQKKPHYHILLTADGKKSFTQLYDIAKSVNGTNLINIGSCRGYYRYFMHLDNPEKAQYSEIDVRTFCGFNADNFSKPCSAVRYQSIRDMLNYITKNNITEFSDFLLISMDLFYDDWFKLLCDNSAIIIKNFIDSRREKLRRNDL